MSGPVYKVLRSKGIFGGTPAELGSHKNNARFTAVLMHLTRPEACLDFADVGLAEEIHAKARLADPTSDRFGEFPGKKPFMKKQFLTLGLSLDLQLSEQGLFVDPNTHG